MTHREIKEVIGLCYRRLAYLKRARKFYEADLIAHKIKLLKRKLKCP